MHTGFKRIILFTVYIQVETVGDMYMAVSGLPDPCSDHARCIAHLALDMMDAVKKAEPPQREKSKVRGSWEHGKGEGSSLFPEEGPV